MFLLSESDVFCRGPAAYRLQFCSRQLVLQFSYVWLSMMWIHALVGPAMILILENSVVKSVMQRAKYLVSPGKHIRIRLHERCTDGWFQRMPIPMPMPMH